MWVGEEFPEPGEHELAGYAYCAIPAEQRPRPTCGKVTTGRRVHKHLGEPMCHVCARAEQEYQRLRRDLEMAS